MLAKSPAVVAGLLLLLLSAIVLLACGAEVRTAATDPVTVTVTKTVPREAKQQIKRHTRRHAPASSSARYVACDANITVRTDTTTCGFAQNVFYEYWRSGQSAEFDAYSPATRATFSTTCREAAGRITCTTADRGAVRFPQAAVDSYTQAQADTYAAKADLGPGSDPEATPSTDAVPDADAGSNACDPNYEGACLDPNSYDYDCEGGSGDGPDYTGEVVVVDGDPFGLDRDGNGVACDW